MTTTGSGGEEGAKQKEIEDLQRENERLRSLLGLPDAGVAEAPARYTLFPLGDPLPSVDDSSPLEDKTSLMRALFRGREDVHAERWTSSRSGKAGYSPAVAGGWSASRGTAKQFLPLTDDVIVEHLAGRRTIGIYPLMHEDVCSFLAADFDGTGWPLDALAYWKVSRAHEIPAYIERSRSGEGAHVWIFFAEPVEAAVARRLGTGLLREAMVERSEIDLQSYDRLFPSQDFVPKGSFGNLIVLPLQGSSRRAGNTEFLDPSSLKPHGDQWAFLSEFHRLTRAEALDAANDVRAIDAGPHSTDNLGRVKGQPAAPPTIACVAGAVLSVERSGLPPALLSAIKHLATLHNPEFYKRQKLRLSTFQTPRFIRCYEEDLASLHLPRGILQELEGVVRKFGSTLSVNDRRSTLSPNPLAFRGKLDAAHEKAVSDVIAHDEGVLVAPPGSGKTVMGCAVIAARRMATLVLVHREPLLDQWRARLAEHLGMAPEQIGIMAKGKDKRTGIVDLVMIQSLRAIEDLDAFFDPYGHLIIDECHHVPAVSFDAVVKRAPVRCILGLTATPYRKDGLEDLITMRCGPIRHQIDRGTDRTSGIELRLRLRTTNLALDASEGSAIQEVFRRLVDSEERSLDIARDVVRAAMEGRRCLVLSQWKEHVRALADLVREAGVEPIVLEGGTSKKRREEELERIAQVRADQPLVIASTGQYIGEGFDCPQLDTLFLAFPVAFKGKLVQYTGRILRSHEGKQSAVVYDYIDSAVPVLKAMSSKRLPLYRTLGFHVDQDDKGSPPGEDQGARQAGAAVEFDGYWIHVSAPRRPAYEIKGKYLFFSEDKDRLVSIATNEITNHGFHRAKVNAELLGANREHVLCLYYRDDSRNPELAERAKEEYGVKFRYWKSDADTRGGRYSDEFLGRLDPKTRTHFARESPDEDRE